MIKNQLRYSMKIFAFNLDKIIKDETIIFGNLPYNIFSNI